MFNSARHDQFQRYKEARTYFLQNPGTLISLEKLMSDSLYDLLDRNVDEIVSDYDEASKLYPFWQNYPPDNRGRMPKGDQYPWIEVGEQVFGNKLLRLLEDRFKLRDAGLPSGPDKRMILSSNEIREAYDGFTDSCWLFLDIKSVGPRDDQEHAVMSHNQVSGDGKWDKEEDPLRNTPITAQGVRTSHKFHVAIPPIYILSDGTIAPVVSVVIKPVYRMLSLKAKSSGKGQPLQRMSVVTIPNGLLLTKNPGYLKKYPRLFFPGKDDKGKKANKIRARVSFGLLRKIDSWRVRTKSV